MTVRPKIGLNGRFLVANRTGVQRSAYRLFRGIIEKGERFDFVLFTGQSEAFAPEWQKPYVSMVCCDLYSQNAFRNHLWEQFTLPKLANAHGVQILHSPANLAPVFCKQKTVVNIHDLCFLIQPNWFSLNFRTFYSLLIPKIAKKASIIITNSNNSKNDILELLGVDINRIRLTYWAVEPLFFTYDTPFPYENRPDRILFVGSLEPRKNLGGLILAFNIFRRRNPTQKTQLSIVGCTSSVFANHEYELGEFSKDIEFLGYISDKSLAAMYASSRVLVYPSFYEGFGFPPLEAMATGTPVITSACASLPETVGTAALVVDPSNPEDIADKIENVLLQPAVAHQLIEKGRQRARFFSWDVISEHVLGIYEDLLNS